MKKNKILINIENISDIEEYKKIGLDNFLFAVKDFSIGYKCFNIGDIKGLECNKFLLINRVFNNEDVDNFKKIILELDGIEGIIFEDIAVYNMLKNTNIKLIWNQNHFASSYSSINYWLEMVSSAVISNELTKEEVSVILDKSDKPLILNIFGKNPVMYSRRTLLTNFNKNFNLENNKEVILKENITNNLFETIESDKGTFVLNNNYFNIIPYLNLFNNNKILYYLIYPNGLKINEIEDLLNKKDMDNSDDGFMNKKTIYKLRGE